MSRTIIPAPRRIVTPQGGWWTGAGAMRFNGAGDDVIGTIPAAWGAATCTFTTWIFLNRVISATYQVVWACGTITASQSFYFGTNGNHLVGGIVGHHEVSATNLAVGMVGFWNHACLLLPGNGAKAQLYLNGLLRATAAVNATTQAITGTVCKFGRHLNNTFPASVLLCTPKIYKGRLLTPSEIAADYRGEIIDSTGLIRHWPLEAKVGATTHERIGNTYDAVTGAIIDANVVPWRARTVAPARTLAPARSAA